MNDAATEGVVITLAGAPVPFAHRQTAGGRRFTPSRQKEYMAALKLKAEHVMAGRALFSGPLQLDLYAGLPIPRSWSARKQTRAAAGEIWPTVKPDRKNLLSIAEDALIGVVFRDDSLICTGEVVKTYSLTPGIVIRVHPLDSQSAGGRGQSGMPG